MARTAIDDISALVAPLVDALGCRVYDVEVSGSGRARTVRVLVDRDGGVDLETVTAATKSISHALDASPVISGPYLLEVSSPGIERPLRRPAHFASAIGATVAVNFHTENGPRRSRGVLVEAGDEQCVVEHDGVRDAIAYVAVTKARTVFEWGPQPRPGAKSTKRERDRAPKRAAGKPVSGEKARVEKA